MVPPQAMLQRALVTLLAIAAPVTAQLGFSGVFSDHAVLQRATTAAPKTQAAVYGGGAKPGATVAVKVGTAGLGEVLYRDVANADGSWKVLLAPKPAGGDFTVTATSGAESAELQHVTYGDVWICSGQSNMELNLHFTFEKNDTFAAVGAGKYKNIRIFHLGHNPMPFRQMAHVVNDSLALSNWTIMDETAVNFGGHGDQCPPSKGGRGKDCTALDQFSAACFYFAQSLTDRMAEDVAQGGAEAVVPLGMIETAWGGTTIEQWVPIGSQLQCQNISCHANASIPVSPSTIEQCTHDVEMGNGGLYGGMIAPYVNMSITGWLWYQGENNLFATAGNVLPQPSAPAGTGYACLLRQQMTSWREAFSAVPNTTPQNAPFGIVQLADGTDEGWGCNIRQMHSAETGNYGVVPNPAFQNAFVAAAHDLGEPWDDGCKRGPTWCCTCMNKTRDPSCAVGVDSPFDPKTKFPWLIDIRQPCMEGQFATPQLMGGVHPSTKIHVGERLAQAAWSLHYMHPEVPFTGPVVSACGLEKSAEFSGATTLRVEFNTTLLGAEKVEISAYNKTEQASATFVRVGTPLPDNAWENLVYQNRAPWWEDDSTWHSVDIVPSTSGTGFVIDLPSLWARSPELIGSAITAVKYGQGIPGTIPQSGHKRVCCGTRDISTNPCPPKNCPISAGALPAMPFMAALTAAGDCVGIKPMVITGLK